MAPRQSKLRSVRNTLIVTIALTAGAAVIPDFAAAGADIVTNAPPPPDRIEHAPPRRDGYVWGPGHWEWNGRSYAWVSGTWIMERRASHWVADRWEQVGAQWHYLPGHWEHAS
jgi:WXXGXW repeat (2 copies)